MCFSRVIVCLWNICLKIVQISGDKVQVLHTAYKLLPGPVTSKTVGKEAVKKFNFCCCYRNFYFQFESHNSLSFYLLKKSKEEPQDQQTFLIIFVQNIKMSKSLINSVCSFISIRQKWNVQNCSLRCPKGTQLTSSI